MSSALGIKSTGKAGRRGSWRAPMSPRDGNLPAMVSLRRDRVASRKVRALWALSQREMTSGAPAAGAGEREDLTSPTGLIGGQWLGRSRPCPITWLRPPGARACSLLRNFTVYLYRLLLLPRRACRFAAF